MILDLLMEIVFAPVIWVTGALPAWSDPTFLADVHNPAGWPPSVGCKFRYVCDGVKHVDVFRQYIDIPMLRLAVAFMAIVVVATYTVKLMLFVYRLIPFKSA